MLGDPLMKNLRSNQLYIHVGQLTYILFSTLYLKLPTQYHNVLELYLVKRNIVTNQLATMTPQSDYIIPLESSRGSHA